MKKSYGRIIRNIYIIFQVDARVCLNLCCDNNTKFKFWNIPLYGKAPAADGSPCGNGRVTF